MRSAALPSASLLAALLLLLLLLAAVALASVGDWSYAFRRCVESCTGTCTSTTPEAYAAKQPFYERWLRWDCAADCSYDCMWVAVEAFHNDGRQTPQFFGKWPFIKWLGMQEPASAIFSIANGAVHLWQIQKFRATAGPLRAPMYYIWHIYFVVALNTWVWSTVFHTRDFGITEKMDYFSASLLVVTQFYGVIARYLITRSRVWSAAAAIALLLLFFRHVHQLTVHFDYGYHVTVSVSVGLVNSFCWLLWCYVNRRRQPYVWKCAVSISVTVALALLEVLDFPPLLWTFDAHSLWHAGTAPLTILWYSFLTDDCVYLAREQDESGRRVSSEKSA